MSSQREEDVVALRAEASTRKSIADSGYSVCPHVHRNWEGICTRAADAIERVALLEGLLRDIDAALTDSYLSDDERADLSSRIDAALGGGK